MVEPRLAAGFSHLSIPVLLPGLVRLMYALKQ